MLNSFDLFKMTLCASLSHSNGLLTNLYEFDDLFTLCLHYSGLSTSRNRLKRGEGFIERGYKSNESALM